MADQRRQRPTLRQSPSRSPRQGRRPAEYTRHTARPSFVGTYEVTFLPGLEDVVRAEVADVLGPQTPVLPVPDREDSMLVRYPGAPTDLLALRTVVAVFTVLTFDVPRPKSLSSGEYFPQIVDAVRASARLDNARTFRFEAAGRDSSVFVRLAAQLAEATRLAYDDTSTSGRSGAQVSHARHISHDSPGNERAEHADGAVVLRFRRTPTRDEGWDVLVRLGSRPSSARAWRVADFPGAVNATIAAAIVRLAGVHAEDRVVNLMCGSATLLVERLLAGPAACAIGVDVSSEAIAAATANLAAAGLTDRAELVEADMRSDAWRTGPFDLVLADPPWGTLVGTHATNPDLHRDLLRIAHDVTKPTARLVVLTHEVRMMERVLRESDQWTVREVMKVFQKGHHPRIYLLDKVDI
jgi:tRNA (guanine6-N2)-methyltransferase